jgi:hypothetical protein
MTEVDLEKLGLINQNLFTVKGEIASRYNAVLKNVFDLECKEDNFRIDKRGLSPELSKYFKEKYPERLEFGENYLNMGSANQFMVIVSPDQKNSPLVAPQTSYEDKLYEAVYKTARHTIENVVEKEALFGELDNHISMFKKAEDLLQLRLLEVSLDTVNQSVKASSKLEELSKGLDEDNNALNKNYIDKMLELVRKNVKTDMPDIFPVKMEVHCFYAEFFKGVHCLRNFKNDDDIRAVFIYHHQKTEKLGEEVAMLDLHSHVLLDMLHKYDFVRYNTDLVLQRLQEIEDDVLLGKGIDVENIPAYQRKRLVVQHEKEFPESWNELRKIHAIMNNAKETEIEEVIEKNSIETKIKLAEPVSKEDIINHMFAELDPTDAYRIYLFNKRKFITEFPALPLNRKNYVVNIILNKLKGGKE